MSAKKTVGIWIRVSTEDQKHGESPENHKKRAEMYAELKGWEVVEVYHLEGVSGKSVIEHYETKRMLKDVKTGRIKGLIFSKLARLARNTRELMDFAETFEQRGADLVSLQESIDTSTPAGRFFYTLMSAMAQWEREEISERVAASVPVRAKMGRPLGGQAPYGYRWEDKKLVIDEEETPVRKLMFELFAEHKRKNTVARILNERGYRTRNGSKFTYTTITRLLTDPTAKGLRRTNYTKSTGQNKKWELKDKDDWVFQEVPAIVSDKLWDEVNAEIKRQSKNNKKPSKKTTHLFAGFVYCHCGTKMYVLSNSPKYTCQNCRNKIPADDLEEIFHSQLQAFLLSEDQIRAQIDKADSRIADKEWELQSLQKKAKDIETKMDSLVDLFQEGELPKKGFSKHYDPLTEQYEQIESQMLELQSQIDTYRVQLKSSDQVLTEALNLQNQWPQLPRDSKRIIIENITNRIDIGKDEITIDLSYLPQGDPTNLELVANDQHNHKGSWKPRA